MKIFQISTPILGYNQVTLFHFPTSLFTVTLAGCVPPRRGGQMYSASDYSSIRDAQECVLIDLGH